MKRSSLAKAAAVLTVTPILAACTGGPKSEASGSVSPSVAAVTMPDVVGMEYGDAKKVLEGMGFTVERRNKVGTYATGVRHQDPAANSVVDEGSTVTLVVVSPKAEPAADDSWDHGLVIGPSFDWVQGGTVSLWSGDNPPVYLAIIHAPHGYYALGLRTVAPCPPDDSGSGEGQYIDKRTGDIVFDCANGEVWARFDWFGRSVPGAPYRVTRPAYKVIPKEDGRLVVTRQPPPLALTAYW
jgi:hypothetical protein